MSRNFFAILAIATVAGMLLLFMPPNSFAAPPGGGGGHHGGGGGGARPSGGSPHPSGGSVHPSGGGAHFGGYPGGYYGGGYYPGYGWGYPYGGFGIGLGIGLGLGYDPYYYDVYRPTIINVVPYAADPVIYSAPAAAYAPPARTAPAEDRAYLTVQLPVDEGEVWIEGEKTAQDKAAQEYVSPQLTPGKKYYYEVRAKWTANGKQFEAKRSFPIYPGKPVLVDFTEPAELPSEK